MNNQRRFMMRTLLVALLVLGSICTVNAKDYDNWKEKWDVPSAPALEPKEQHETFRTAPGFSIELAAAEPHVVDPVVVRWDASGRMWVVEMRGYMHDVKGKGEDQPIGKIVVLEDGDNDGYYEDRTVFMDDLVMPRAIALVEGGVLISAPPNLWYAKDTDGDLEADTRETLLSNYAKDGNVEHRENALRIGIDNWIYNAKSNRRFLFDLNENGEPELQVDNTRFRGQWGISQDSYGRLYYNTNSNYLSTEHYPENLEKHNYKLTDDDTSSTSVASDQLVFPIRINPGVNRGYRPNTLRDDGRLKTTTGVSGQTVYRGDQFPDALRGDVFVPDVAGNVIAHFNMKRSGSSITAEHKTFDDQEWGKREFLASKDERFRPVDIEGGPDGTLYAVDFYRGIIQHETYMTDKYLKKQVLARNLDEPVGLGRIWRIRYDDNPRRSSVESLQEKSSGQLVDLLSHPNGWHRDWAQRLLIRREDASVHDDLRKLARDGDHHLGRIHAIWTLEGLGALNRQTMKHALKDEHRQVRVAAARARGNRQAFAPTDFEKLEDGKLEAEHASKLSGPKIDSNHDGYSGDGFINFSQNKGGALILRLRNVSAGTYKLQMRYAIGDSDSRPLKLNVNGDTVRERIPFPGTGGWSSWETTGVRAKLNEGKNTIKLITTGNEGPNLDHITFEKVK